ncbi:purine-nucleoside phosphorylase [Mycoplasmatota bacterium zrk1]
MYNKVLESVNYIKSKVKYKPKVSVVLGSGLGDLVNQIENQEIVEYEEIPNFPKVTVKGHSGKLVFGTIEDVEIVVLSGRFHFYEGYDMKQVTYPIYVMKLLGIEKMIITNACGGINKNFKPGSLMIIDDFINLMGTNPLVGANDERFGPRFPDMTEPYKLYLIEKAKQVGKDLNIKLEQGVYAGFQGPYYETRAEIKMIAGFGADTVGMSTVPETIVCNQLGIDTLGISCVTNMATGIQETKHSHDNVVKAAQETSVKFVGLVSGIIAELG